MTVLKLNERISRSTEMPIFYFNENISVIFLDCDNILYLWEENVIWADGDKSKFSKQEK